MSAFVHFPSCFLGSRSHPTTYRPFKSSSLRTPHLISVVVLLCPFLALSLPSLEIAARALLLLPFDLPCPGGSHLYLYVHVHVLPSSPLHINVSSCITPYIHTSGRTLVPPCASHFALPSSLQRPRLRLCLRLPIPDVSSISSSTHLYHHHPLSFLSSPLPILNARRLPPHRRGGVAPFHPHPPASCCCTTTLSCPSLSLYLSIHAPGRTDVLYPTARPRTNQDR
ncbi:hypothetical protein L227DRAFT_230148 [Lentinus tigrinus ALCF2SS1-6]|uniref:Uncharacterized protein n=1 Tax=Lentinus tigrinus ALCF2SS1-6 TaxID=1328759 RepID=A0A5C2S1U9_9APHY|nr:hypothetical protein L227DRAFT_230148 [Lentinus tigrinus ALCF2SS1-6]